MAIREIPFTCKKEQLTIRGMYVLPCDPADNDRFPVIIFSHGYLGNYRDMEQFCRDFAKEGYAAFCFSFCGGGNPHGDESLMSEGRTTDMSVFTEVEDLSAVIEYAKSLPFVDETQIILAGGSQGGFVSGLTAARYGEAVSKLIMIFPALCIPDHARRGCLGGASYDPAAVPEELRCPCTVLGRKFHEEMAVFDPYLALAAYHGPVLILHGTEDTIVDHSYSVRAQANYGKGQCRLQLIRNMGHGMDEGQYESVAASIRQFLNGKEEILTIRVVITHEECAEQEDVTKQKIYFTGYCETPYFQGAVLPGGCDTREYKAGVQTSVRAEYTLEGLDCDGAHCRIHIVNQPGGADWKPAVSTDSKVLGWLNGADLTAVLEYGAGGPTVRIFADRH